MSANAWRICPRCKAVNDKRKVALKKDVINQYGKGTPEEYLKIVFVADKKMKKKLEETLREDYEIYTDEDGVFYISYGCQCDKCGLTFDFKYKEKLKK